MDASQDWFLLLAEENDFGTVLKMARRLVSCDRTDDSDIEVGIKTCIMQCLEDKFKINSVDLWLCL